MLTFAMIKLSDLLEELDLKKVSMAEVCCNGGHSPIYEITFVYSNASFAATFVVYDECDELIADESDLVEVKKLKPEWYLKTVHNFP